MWTFWMNEAEKGASHPHPQATGMMCATSFEEIDLFPVFWKVTHLR